MGIPQAGALGVSVNFRSYLLCVLLVALPMSVLGAFMAMLATHSGGIVLWLGLSLTPAIWFLDKLLAASHEFSIALAASFIFQFFYWTLLILLANKLRKVRANYA